jgi:kelch-like protein 19
MVENLANDLKSSLEVEKSEDEYFGLQFQAVSSNDCSLQFKSSKYNEEFFRNLKEFQEHEKFCDVVLKCTNGNGSNASPSSPLSPNQFRTIKCHKLVLASSSLYFKAMFTGGFRDEQLKEVTVDQISYMTLESIVDFIYTGNILVKESNVQQLVHAAKMLQIEDIVNACCVFLIKYMDASNCIGIEEFGKTYGCLKLVQKAQKYMLDHFCEIVHSDEFLHLNEQQVSRLIKRDDISVPCETIVFKAVVDWVRFDPEKRRSHLDYLFQNVRFHVMPPKFMKDQLKNNEILMLSECDKSKQHMQKVCDELIAHKPLKHPLGPRKPCVNFSVYIIGGYQRQSVSLVECLKGCSQPWEKCAELHVPRSGISCVSLALYVYAIGGRNNNMQGNTDCADVECYDPFVNKWITRASMSVPRSRAGIILFYF